MLSLIAAVGRNRELGKNNMLLWHIPADLPRFKGITNGHPVIMGRKTFESIGKPLSGRTNIVITTNPAFSVPGVIAVPSVEEALNAAGRAPGKEEIFVIGGGKTYAETIARADRLYLTVVDATAMADTYFPDYSAFTKVIYRESHKTDKFSYTYLTLERLSAT